MVMAQELYTLLTPNPFCLPNDPGNAAVYVCPTLARQAGDNTPLNLTEQATINAQFTRKKQYFSLVQNIDRVCFTALDTSINDAFNVSNNPTIQGWHADMRVIDIPNQLSTIHGQPTLAVIEMNDTVFHSPYLAANAPKVFFWCIGEMPRRLSWAAILTLMGRLSKTPSISSSPLVCISSRLRDGII
jgi:hypothetical protein